MRNAYERNFKKPRLSCGPTTKTKQSFRDECDINVLLKKYERTGLLPEMIKANPKYGDFSNAPDYHEACNIVAKAEEQFANLDAKIRARFQNDPAQFLEFATNPENADEMAKLGLMKKEAVERVETARKATQDGTPMGGGPIGSPKAKPKSGKTADDATSDLSST